MGPRVQSAVGCFHELSLVFATSGLQLQFSVARVHVELRKKFISHFVFPTWAYAAGFNNNNTYYYTVCPAVVTEAQIQ